MAKAVVAGDIGELRKAENLVYGSEETLKMVRKGQIRAVFIASNCNLAVKNDLERLCNLNNLKCVVLSQPSDEVGTICRKPFPISVVGIKA